MASNINSGGEVNSDYPVAGQDNDSQGFRDNFSKVKANFTASKTEIETLQSETAKLNVANNFLGNNISGANFINNSEAYYPGGTISTSQHINFSNGGHQEFTAGADITLTLTAWPATTKTGTLRIYVKADSTQRTITFASNAGAGIIKRNANWPTANNTAVIDYKALVGDQEKVFVFEFTSYDAGANVYADYIGLFQ